MIEQAERQAICGHEWRRQVMNRQRVNAVCGWCGMVIEGRRALRILATLEPS
jgi:succinate dehydrogenase/fumarate reductase-like Fe-S protein